MASPPADIADIAEGDGLVRRCVEGDRAALVELLEFVGPGIRAQLRIDGAWGASLDADDVMQTTYLEVFLRVDQLEMRTVAGFRAWMSTMAQNNLRDALKALQRARRPDPRKRVEEPTRSDSTVELLDRIGCISHTASRDAIAREAEDLLVTALSGLPESYRQVVERIDLAGEAVQSVADSLQRSQGAVYMLRARAHDRLRELLGPRSRMLGSHT
jgi:RNA polymerase sigma factor (sigma-70 family)